MYNEYMSEKALEEALMIVIAERDKLRATVAEYERRDKIFPVWGHVPMKLGMYIDRLVAERNEFEYYADMYKKMSEDLIADKRKKHVTVHMSPYIQ